MRRDESTPLYPCVRCAVVRGVVCSVCAVLHTNTKV